MSWWDVPVNTGLNFLQAGVGYAASATESKARAKWQEYSNTMTALSAAMGQNSITDNEVATLGQFAKDAIQVKQGIIQDVGANEVQAAAAGVTGRSVNRSLFNAVREGANREAARQSQFSQTMLGFTNSRAQTAMTGAMNMDYSFIPKASRMASLLSAGLSSYDYYSKREAQSSNGSAR